MLQMYTLLEISSSVENAYFRGIPIEVSGMNAVKTLTGNNRLDWVNSYLIFRESRLQLIGVSILNRVSLGFLL